MTDAKTITELSDDQRDAIRLAMLKQQAAQQQAQRAEREYQSARAQYNAAQQALDKVLARVALATGADISGYNLTALGDAEAILMQKTEQKNSEKEVTNGDRRKKRETR